MRHNKAPKDNDSPHEPDPPEDDFDPCNETQHPLDDDAELAHIGEYSPPPIEVSPDSDSRTGHDAPPPMVKPAQAGAGAGAGAGGEVDPEHVKNVPPLGPLTGQESGQPIDVASAEEALPPIVSQPPRRIQTFEQRLGRGGHESKWKRQPNVTGTGAIHVKSFHCKLTGDSLDFLDSQVNEWLDEHPEYEVKLVTTSVGEWTGKLKEPCLIINVWV